MCVDWCDAYAYCQSLGKRLCGRIGGGETPHTQYDDPDVGQWTRACTSDGAHSYVYGDTYSPQLCNTVENSVTGCSTGSCSTVPGGSLSTCQSTVAGYGGVFDLIGNVWEWEDSCAARTGDGDDCRIRGSSFGDQANWDCNSNIVYRRDFQHQRTGFRCCSNP